MTEEIKFQKIQYNIQIAYTDNERRSAETLLFVHGLANYHGVWRWNIETLKNKYRCIAIDLPGNGRSTRGEFPYTMQFYTDVVIDFIQHMKLGPVTLVAHSMGGMIAMKIALSKEVAVRNLVLFAPAGFEAYTAHESTLFKSAITMGNFLNLDETQIRQSVQSSFYKPGKIASVIIAELIHFIQHNDRSAYRSMLEKSIHSMLDEPLFPELKKISEAALVFFGKDDMMIPNRFLHPVSTVEIAKKAVGEMQQAKLFCYAETGHFVQIERAKEVNEAIEEFLQDVKQKQGVK